ncbi:hypothetical protein Acr_28g0007510 [Actinidia rufa]|uniref:Uncharacterized protein n=1 Tax=Actinidia rufa TaxID=165716 RepID=A0A7J0HAE4_9ERIC|nr:hypothetical protein Acr_28g0007510 [Actinidia rufa]
MTKLHKTLTTRDCAWSMRGWDAQSLTGSAIATLECIGRCNGWTAQDYTGLCEDGCVVMEAVAHGLETWTARGWLDYAATAWPYVYACEAAWLQYNYAKPARRMRKVAQLFVRLLRKATLGQAVHWTSGCGCIGLDCACCAGLLGIRLVVAGALDWSARGCAVCTGARADDSVLGCCWAAAGGLGFRLL